MVLNGAVQRREDGPSRPGSEIIGAFVCLGADFWLLIGIDDFLAKLPFEWKRAGSYRGTFAADGIRFETTPEGATVRLGHVGRQLLPRIPNGRSRGGAWSV